MPKDLQKLLDIVDRAMQLDPAHRTDFILDECASDQVLADKVMRMLESEKSALEYFELPAGEAEEVLEEVLSKESDQEKHYLPEAIGKYKVLQRLGRGGMGEVYLSTVRLGSVERNVAVKIVKRGMDTDAVVARFKAEGNILASLSHPNIARLIDSGTTEDGRAFFVMDFVDGQPVTEFCDVKKMSVDERLSLFEKICHAVHYAHQNLVVHRDLKPSNILVTEDGEIKLLDFGIAKLLESPEDYTAPVTATGQRFYTADYASPEQLAGKGLSTATDVYSLGIILYEILSGTRPFKSKIQSPAEFMTSVMRDMPRKPSVAISGEDVKEIEKIHSARSVSRGGLQTELQGELDTIILKAIRKAPEDRYASAEQLREDIDRFKKGLPILARPATVAYRFKKFYGRNRVSVIAGAGFVAAVIILTTIYISQISIQRIAAERSAERATAVTEFVVGLFEQATRNDGSTNDEHVKAGLLLMDPVLDDIGRLESSPVSQVEVLNIFSSVIHNNVSAARAIELLLTAQSIADSVDIPLEVRSDTWLGLARTYFAVTKYDSAFYYADKSYIGFSEAIGERDIKTLEAFQYKAWASFNVLGHYELFDEAIQKYEDAFGPKSVELADLLQSIGQGRVDVGGSYFERALSIYAQHGLERSANAGITMANLSLWIETDDSVRSLQLSLDAVRILEETAGPSHPQTIGTLGNIGAMYVERRMFRKADSVFAEIYQRYSNLSQDQAIPRPIKAFWYARAKIGLGQYSEAVEILQPEIANLAYDDYRFMPLFQVALRAYKADGKSREGRAYVDSVADSLRAIEGMDEASIQGLYQIVE